MGERPLSEMSMHNISSPQRTLSHSEHSRRLMTPEASTPHTLLSLNSTQLLSELGLADPNAAANLNVYHIARSPGGDYLTFLPIAPMTMHIVLQRAQKAAREAAGGGGALRRPASATHLPPRALAAGEDSAAGGDAGGARHSSTTFPVYRDMTILDSNTSASKKPVVLCRTGCIVLTMPPVRALITRDEAWLFPEDGWDQEFTLFTKVFERREGHGPAASVELLMLTACLSVVLGSLRARLTALKGPGDPQRAQLLETRYKELQEKEADVREVRSDADALLLAAQRLLDDEGDMKALVLEDVGRRARGGGGGGGGAESGAEGGAKAVAEERAFLQAEKTMEVLLEWFVASVESINVDAHSFADRVRGLQKSVEMDLAAEQRRLIQLQLFVQIVTMSFALMSVVSGFYGMNLGNGFCGPDGCLAMGTTDFGHKQFITVVAASATTSLAGGLLFLWWILLPRKGKQV
jgi:hypothetical protein